MAVLFLLLAIVGCVVVGDLVMENPGAGDVTVFNQPINGYSQGLLLAAAAGLGFLVGLLAVGSVGLRRSRRERRRELRTVERDLTEELNELERQNARLREELSRRDLAGRRVAGLSREEQQRSPEPLYEEAGRAARLRGDPDLAFLSPNDRARARQPGAERPGGRPQ
jgi:uncharacterized membrane protein YccC